ncbi:type III pantothenate kinase [Marinicella gelatinilytica]|uniref:type III pantothenate kinase n=1 Tax=Marinicella gelatinilytica TaxID=2996017 RepID=UPI0022608B47|nr:type III pantothenate kinase [Marinicella gelatinilytica]MCX7544033.1 type III pantothenate kinase [Marinicella gelatinilytica]
MILCLDIGNSHMHGGVFADQVLKLQFRMASKSGASSDEYGLFLRGVLRENGLDPASITAISLCTVVPEVLYSIKSACQKYFAIEPFVLQAGVKTGLKVGYQNPQEVGADRIAGAIAASHLFPGKNLIIIDLGTAITFCAVSAEQKYLGGVIMPGLKMAMQALAGGASKLGTVEISAPPQTLGRNTINSIQSGLYYGTEGALKNIVTKLSHELFKKQPPMVIGTGGFAALFKSGHIYHDIVPDLVLKGLYLAYTMNQKL